MNLPELGAQLTALTERAGAAKLTAAVIFSVLLIALGLGYVRIRKQVRLDEVDAAIEADFLRLERDLASAEPEPAPSDHSRSERS